MELVSRTAIKDGKEVNEFVVGCADHRYWYRGRPPITTGCRECWHAYFFAQLVMAGGDMSANVDQLDAAIRHAAELDDKGEFDFKPELSDFKIEHED